MSNPEEVELKGQEASVTITPELVAKIEDSVKKAVSDLKEAKKDFVFHGSKSSEVEFKKAEAKELAVKFVKDIAQGRDFNTSESIKTVHETRMKGINGGVDANGGFLVPEVFETDIFATFDNYNEILQDANIVTFNRPGRVFNLNELSTRVTAYFTDENSTGVTGSTPTFTEPQIAIYDVLGACDITEDFMEDTEADIMSNLALQFGEAHAQKIQSRLIDETVTVSGVVMKGIFTKGNGATTVTQATTASGYTAIKAGDIENLYFNAIAIDNFQAANKNGKFYMDPLTLKALRDNIRAAATENDYLTIFNTAEMTLLGRPVVLTNQAPTPATTVSDPYVLYADLSKHLQIRRKRGLTMKINTQGTSLSGRNLNYQLGRELVVTQRIGHCLTLTRGMVHLVTR